MWPLLLIAGGLLAWPTVRQALERQRQATLTQRETSALLPIDERLRRTLGIQTRAPVNTGAPSIGTGAGGSSELGVAKFATTGAELGIKGGGLAAEAAGIEGAAAVAGTAAAGVGAAAGVAFGALALSEGRTEEGIGTLGGAGIGAAVGAIFGPVGALIGAGIGAAAGGFLGGLFAGKPQLTHAQREARETSRVLGQAAGFQGEIQRAKSLPELTASVIRWQSGYVGGTSSLAVGVGVIIGESRANELKGIYDVSKGKAIFRELVRRGDIILPTGASARTDAEIDRYFTPAPGPGRANVYYPVFTPQGFVNYALENPEGVYAGIQAGVTPGNLTGGNDAIARTILIKLDELLPNLRTTIFHGGGV